MSPFLSRSVLHPLLTYRVHWSTDLRSFIDRLCHQHVMFVQHPRNLKPFHWQGLLHPKLLGQITSLNIYQHGQTASTNDSSPCPVTGSSELLLFVGINTKYYERRFSGLKQFVLCEFTVRFASKTNVKYKRKGSMFIVSMYTSWRVIVQIPSIHLKHAWWT